MAILQNIRVKFGLVISIIIALALLSFIIDPSTLQSAVASMSSKYDVGEINGKAISYTDFQEEVEKYSTINEIVSGTTTKNDQQQKQIREAAWQEQVDQYLFFKKAKAAGIGVGEAEMVALTTGDMVSPILSQNYAFAGEDGTYDAQRLVDFVQSLDSDQSGRLSLYWKYLQNSVYTQQMYAKYGALFTASAYQNPLMRNAAIAENNTTASVDFVMVPFGYETDSTIVVSGKDIKNYYDSHKKFFKQQASRDAEYVVYEVIPSAEDISATNEAILAVYDDFANSDNIKNFLLKNSDRSYSDYWYKAGELNTISSAINDYAFSAKPEKVSEIINDGNTFYAARIMESAMISDSAYVKHILFQGDNAKAEADSVLAVLKAGKLSSFSAIAAANSADQGSAADGEMGNIGWMTQTYMIPGFESVITAEINKPFIVKTQYGTHIVLVSKKSKPVAKKKVAILEKTALASKETFNDYYAKANRFATLAAGSIENYQAAVDSMGVYSHPMNHVTEGTSSYGAIDNAKEVTRWIFDNKAGKVSNIITVNNNYFFVVAVKDIHKEGYSTIAEQASSIRDLLYMEKLGEKKAAEIAEKIDGMTDLQQVAEALNTTVSTHSGVAFSSMGNQGLDPKFIGAVASAKENEISGPVAGSIGVYVFSVTARDNGAFYTEDDAANYQTQLAQYNAQMILPVMMDDAGVKDNRERFY